MAYTLITGSTVNPPQLSFQAIDLNSNINLIWPLSFTNGIAAAGFNNINAIDNGYIIYLPDATLASAGTDVVFNNVSLNTFQVADYGGNILLTVDPGQITDFKIYDNSTQEGSWGIIPYLGGYNGLVAIQIESSDNSITITDGDITSPGGIVNLQLPESINNLNNVSTPSFAVITDTNPLTWVTRELIAGENIVISNSDGINDDPIISLSSSPTALASISVGDFTITGSVLDCNSVDTDLQFTTSGLGKININGVLIDTNNNVSNVNDLTVTGTFNNPLTPSAWCVFTDIIVGLTNDITIQSQVNIASVTGSNGNYKLTFATPLNNINYAVYITPGTNGGSTPFVSRGMYTVREMDYVNISIVDDSGVLVQDVQYSVSVLIISL